MGDPDSPLFAAKLEHMGPVVENGVEAGTAMNKRFRAFVPATAMLVPGHSRSRRRRITSPV
jgi:hypothetical protein